MTRTRVRSSNLRSVGYDDGSRMLEVEFRGGGVYQYFRVPPEVFAELMAADSLGRYLNENVKEVYKFRKIR